MMWYCLVCLVVLFDLSDAVAADILMWYCLICLMVLFDPSDAAVAADI